MIVSAIFTLALLSPQLSAKTDKAHHGDYTPHIEKIEILGKHENHSHLYELAPAISYLSGEELYLRSKQSLGETLKNLPGVNSTDFGPTASRPVIRGLGGERIRILQNGIGVLDASGTSEDHAVPANPMAADSIEVVRGPINLLYGSSAIGGVVNIVNSRIHRHFDRGIFTGVDFKSYSANSSQNYAGKIDYGTNNWMFHLDGYFNESQNLKVPGPQKEVKNSQGKQYEAAAGVTYFNNDSDYFGLSYSNNKNNYGVVAEEDVTIDLNQERFDFASKIWTNGWLEAIQIKSAQSFYKHTEFEGPSPGTKFKNAGNETRIEAFHGGDNGLSGILGLQTNTFDFSATGEEAFLPSTKNIAAALFAFEEYTSGSFKYNFGLRAEHNQSTAEAGPLVTSELEKSFLATSVGLGSIYKYSENFSYGVNLSYNERAPNFQELYSNGAHIATASFEVGDSSLQKENSVGLELSVRNQSGGFQNIFTVFGQNFSNYINLQPTGTFDDTDESSIAGDSPDDFQIYNYQMIKAELYGAEFESSYQWNMGSGGKSVLQLTLDYLRGRNTSASTNLPRISPFRANFQWNHKYKSLGGQLGLEYADEQRDLAPNERRTPAYLMVHLGTSYQIDFSNNYWTLFAQVNNVFDVEARNHISLIKNKMQINGRNLMLGLRGYF